jgi:hypothetical protein
MEEGEDTTKPTVNFHLEDYNLIGGLTQPKSNHHWKSLPSTKIKNNPNLPKNSSGIKKAGRGK